MPAKKAAAKAAAKTAAPKAAAKKTTKTTQTTLKTAASKKRPIQDSDDEDSPDRASAHDASLLSNTPPSAKKQKKAPASKKTGGVPLQELENESMILDGASDKQPPKAKSSTDRYQKITQLQHIIKRPDTYIGSVERTEMPMWVYNSLTQQMDFRKVNFVPGLYKIFDEILVNAADNKQNDATMRHVKVTIDRELGQISVENDGKGIPIEIHSVSNLLAVIIQELTPHRKRKFISQR